MAEPLRINKWQDGIADSPNLGHALIKNADVDVFSGAVRSQIAPSSLFTTLITTRTFTANAGTDLCTASGVLLASGGFTGTAVTFSTTGTLPAGLVAGTIYFLIAVSTTTFKVATTLANANAATAIDITDAGSGTHTVTTISPGTIRHMVRDPRTGNKFYQDSNMRVWYTSSSNAFLLPGNTITANSGVGNGLAILRTSDGSATYLFAFRNAAIDVVNVYGDTQLQAPTWSNSWQSMNSTAGSGNSHFALQGQDFIIYFTDDRYVGSIKENAGSVFDPATGGTYTYNNQALDLPQGEVAYWLTELGVNLLISGQSYDKVYPWDRVSDSFTLPLTIPEYNVNKMINIGNVVYILAGTMGNIYSTQGTYVKLFKSMPTYITNNSNTVQSNPISWGGIGTKKAGLLVGMSTVTSGNSGVYFITPDGRLTMDQMPSTGSGNVTAILSTDEFYLIGYSGGADSWGSTRYASFETVLQSELFKVGNKTQKATYSEIEVQLMQPVAASNSHIRIKYRTDTSTAFADFPGGAVSFTSDGTNTSFNSEIGLIDLENLQVQVEMDGNLELIEVRLFP